MRTKIILLMVVFIHVYSGTVFCQTPDSIDPFLRLSLDDQVNTYFDTFRDGHTQIPIWRYAGYIVRSYGLDVIPYMKEQLKSANFFTLCRNPPLEENPRFYEGESNDITLSLIGSIWASLHDYANPVFQYLVNKPYTLDDELIEWFISEYKKRIDEYIITTRFIDETVMISETLMYWIAGPDCAITLPRYGHLYSDKLRERRGNDLKKYYEERLGITGLEVVPPFIE